jgi:hypothetical protein
LYPVRILDKAVARRLRRSVIPQLRDNLARGHARTLTYLLSDGHFGNSPALQMAQQCGLHLISKLRADAALYVPYDGPYQSRGPRRKYGAKLDYEHLPAEYVQQTSVDGAIETPSTKQQCCTRSLRSR